MTEKMMRIAGRDPLGNAKGISVDVNGDVKVSSHIISTDRIIHNDFLGADSTVELLNTDKEVVLNSLICAFSKGDTSSDSMMISFGGQGYQVPDLTDGTLSMTAFLTPKNCLYDGLFETLIDEPNKRVVRLRKEIRIKGLRIALRNRDSVKHRTRLIAVYSEVE